MNNRTEEGGGVLAMCDPYHIIKVQVTHKKNDNATRSCIYYSPRTRCKFHSIIRQEILKLDTFDRPGLVVTIAFLGGGTVNV